MENREAARTSGSKHKKGRRFSFLVEELQVDILSYSLGHIDAIVSEEQGRKKWRFTRFYGHSEASKRGESWSLLEDLSCWSNLPWVCM